MHVAFEIIAAALELVFLAINKVFRNLFAVLVDLMVKLNDFLLEYEFSIFIIDRVVLSANFDFVSSDLDDNIGF